MAQCLLCKATIPESMQYCENCNTLEKNHNDESYLDELLNSIAPSEEEVNRFKLFKKKEQSQKEQKGEEKKSMKEDIFGEIPRDYSIFSKSEEDIDLDFLQDLFDTTGEEETAATTLSITEDVIPEDNYEQQDNTINELMEAMMDVADQEKTSDTLEKESGTMSVNGNLSENDQDILDLINVMNSTEELPPLEDLTGYDHHSDMDYHSEEDQFNKNQVDIGDVFSDALGAVNELKDHEYPIDEDLLNMITNIESSGLTNESESEDVKDIELSKEKKAKKEKKEKQSKKEKKNRSIGAALFGNIKEKRSEEELEELKQKVIQEAEEKERAKKEKKLAAKEEKKQKKAKKAEDARIAKEEAKRLKAEKKKKQLEKKEAKAQHSREIQELIDEIDEGRINKVGASIIFAFFATVAVVIVVGTNVYSYSLNIKNAKENFEIQHYNEAYYNVYGINIREEDLEIYDKIMTVMYVNKQLNSYETYCNLGKYPQALDSLLKGLERYDKYYTLATMLGIEDDLNYVRGNIVEKLNATFQVTEEEAKTLLEEEDQEKYSVAVYKLVSERVELSKEGNLVDDTKKKD